MGATGAIGNEGIPRLSKSFKTSSKIKQKVLDRKLDYSFLLPMLQLSMDKLYSYNLASHSSIESPLFGAEFHYKTSPMAYHS